MAKQIILIILLTLAAIFFRPQLSHVLDMLVYLHNSIAGTLARIFSGNDIGRLLQDVIALLLIPLVLGGIVGVAFWLIKREMMPNVMMIVWVIWLVLLTTMIAQHGMQPVPAQNAGENAPAQTTPPEVAPADQGMQAPE